MFKPLKFEVVRPKDTVVVLVMKHKNEDVYSYVNLTKGHICPCKFASVEDAIADMDKLKEQGKLLYYKQIFEDVCM